jgi:lantibiotic modifying enzyme
MPNFAHGTAGIATFLARLYEVTGDSTFLENALSGGKRLLSLTHRGLVCHHLPEGEDLFYLGWCHGPAGTGRLYYRLWKITGDPVWEKALAAGAHAILESGIPENRTPGFWNNVSVCCGSAGIADFFLELNSVMQNEAYPAFSDRLSRQLLECAVCDSTGAYWIQAEHRVRPDLLIAQTGLMQGAAGIGITLLRQQAFKTGHQPFIRMPDRF